jgi:IS30 family transposase
VLFGRPPKLTPHQRREAIARRDAGDETLTDIARSDNVSHSTISRVIVGNSIRLASEVESGDALG